MQQAASAIAPDQLVRSRATLGDFDLTVCTDGSYRLDGGAMFGVVPRTLWQKRVNPDEQNRIRLGLNTVIVRTGTHTIAIETGLGNKQPPKGREIYANQELLPQSLKAAGIAAQEIDIVLNTHLHFDHCGWNTTLHPDGGVTPTFPNARYFAPLGEVEHGHRQFERDGVSYISDNYDPLVKSGQMTLLSDDQLTAGVEIVPGVRVELYPGHTNHMMAVHLEPVRKSESRPPGSSPTPHACYIGDLIPTTNHLDITWCMGYDLDPMRCIEERKRFYSHAIPGEWLVLFTHDHDQPMGRVKLNERGKPVLVAGS